VAQRSEIQHGRFAEDSRTHQTVSDRAGCGPHPAKGQTFGKDFTLSSITRTPPRSPVPVRAQRTLRQPPLLGITSPANRDAANQVQSAPRSSFSLDTRSSKLAPAR